MRDGETFKAKIVENSNLSELSKKISKAVKHVGNLDCDLILSNKKFFIIDFNPRFGGGYPFTHLAGKNYIMKIICNLLKKNYRIRKKAKLLTAMKSINLTVKMKKKIILTYKLNNKFFYFLKKKFKNIKFIKSLQDSEILNTEAILTFKRDHFEELMQKVSIKK